MLIVDNLDSNIIILGILLVFSLLNLIELVRIQKLEK